MITVPDVSDDGGNKEECIISPQSLTTHNTFAILQPNFLLLHKETFSLCCFDMLGCLVAVVEKEKKKQKKKTPTATTGV